MFTDVILMWKEKKMKTINDVAKYMDSINPHDTEYEYNKLYFYENDEWYEHILAAVKKLRQCKKSC